MDFTNSLLTKSSDTTDSIIILSSIGLQLVLPLKTILVQEIGRFKLVPGFIEIHVGWVYGIYY